MNGQDLKEFIRDELLWTQQQFGAYIGVGANSVTRWIRGTYEIPPWVDRMVEHIRALRKIHAKMPAEARRLKIPRVEAPDVGA